jgi:hypothetical protein
MSIDALTELYGIMKEYVPSKERQAAADNIVSVLVDFLSDGDLKEFAGYDSYLERAMKEYGGGFDDEEDEEDEEDYDYDED